MVPVLYKLGLSLGSLWCHFGITWGDFGVTLVPLWGHFGVTLGSLGVSLDFVVTLGSLRGRFGRLPDQFVTKN